MKGRETVSERLVVLFLFGIMVLSPPFMFIFDRPAQIAGIPVLYLYLFVIWAVIITLIAFAIELSESEQQEENDGGAPPTGDSPDLDTAG